MTNGEPAPKKVPKRRVPSVRSFAAGGVASVVAVFSVLAFRVHAGDDPAIASTKVSNNTTTTTTTTSSSSDDPYERLRVDEQRRLVVDLDAERRQLVVLGQLHVERLGLHVQ